MRWLAATASLNTTDGRLMWIPWLLRGAMVKVEMAHLNEHKAFWLGDTDTITGTDTKITAGTNGCKFLSHQLLLWFMSLYYDDILQHIGRKDEHNTLTGVSGELNKNQSAEAQWRHLHYDAECSDACWANTGEHWPVLDTLHFKIKLLWCRTLQS